MDIAGDNGIYNIYRNGELVSAYDMNSQQCVSPEPSAPEDVKYASPLAIEFHAAIESNAKPAWYKRLVNGVKNLWTSKSDGAVGCGEWITGGNVNESCTSLDSAFGNLTVNASSFNSSGKIELGSTVSFDLAITKPECVDDPAALTVTLFANSSLDSGDTAVGVPMAYDTDTKIFSASIVANEIWGPPIRAEIRDSSGELLLEKFIYTQLEFSTPPQDTCDLYPKPKVTPGYRVQVDPSEVIPGESASLFFPMEAIFDCNDTPVAEAGHLQVFFIINNQSYEATPGLNTFYADINTTNEWNPGYYPIGIKVKDKSTNAFLIPESAAAGLVINNPSTNTEIPSVTIGYLNYSYGLDDTAENPNIICNSDDPAATFSWTITRPGPNGNGQTIENFAGATLLPYTFDLLGNYAFKCLVTAGDNETTNYYIRTLEVYGQSVPMPAITAAHNPASGPGSGYNIDFDATHSYSPIGAGIINYELFYGDGSPAESNATGLFSHAYPNPGAGNNAAHTAYLTITDENYQTNTTSIPISLWGD
ncbi:MAG: hypothetical protein U9R38_04755 [Candidatus Margulisiibacteriota bacterium]|nr:hypothetical protein [Candidatus Margulisiibacteriota bacterium]